MASDWVMKIISFARYMQSVVLPFEWFSWSIRRAESHGYCLRN